MKKIKVFEQFINENKSDYKTNESNYKFSFSYKGDDLPTQDMEDWFDNESNQPSDNMDSLEQDEFESILQKDFFEYFHDELIDLTYMEMLDVFDELQLN